MDLTPDTSSDADYTFLVAGDMAAVERQTREFNTTLFWSFLLLGLGLIAAILVQVKVGLAPLAQGVSAAWPRSATAKRGGWTEISPPRSRRWPPNSIP